MGFTITTVHRTVIFVLSLFLGLFFFHQQVLARNDADGIIDVSPDVSLQDAIHTAQNGQILRLSSGVYKGPIRIDKPITVIGSKETVIRGNGNGNVLTIASDQVVIERLTIENSGRIGEDSGILIEDAKDVVVKNNEIRDSHFGIYIKNGRNATISANTIIGRSGHFSQKGNGIHIFKGKDNRIDGNRIKDVQDGVYFDFAEDVTVRRNEVLDSRYGLHYMFSHRIRTEENETKGNITGLMIMDSYDLEYFKNLVSDQFHFRGFGILIYRSGRIVLEENEIIRNSIGISFEEAEDTEFINNIIAGNQIGLEFRRGNGENVFTENNFIGNIVSVTVGREEINLDNGKKGNYWDDYKSYDTDGDGIGDIPYKAGSLYDALLKKQPLWQFYFESPAVTMWTSAEAMFPSFGTVDVYDHNPLTGPAVVLKEEGAATGMNKSLLMMGIIFLGISLTVISKGRKGI